jgi:hypothetical protein
MVEPSREQRLQEALAEYLQAAEAGRAPGRDEFLARHPELADELAAFFRNKDRFEQMAGPAAPARAADAPTLGHAAEAVDSVPLLAERVRDAGVDAPVLRGLAGIIDGSVEPERWTASLTAPKPPARRGKAKAA